MGMTKKDFSRFLVFLKDPENKEDLDELFSEIADLINAFLRKNQIL